MGRLDGRTAIVTGAGRGIGASVARLLAAEGASVVVADLGVAIDGSGRDPGPAEAVVNEIEAAGGVAVAAPVDVSSFEDAERLVSEAVDMFGGVDVLINAAGILRDRMIFNMSEEEWDTVIAVHLKGCFNTTRFVSAHWRQERKGDYRLINFTSIAGLNGRPTGPNYAAAKMGIIGFTWSCANALGRYGATANCISPAASTRMADTIPPELLATYRAGPGAASGDPKVNSPDNIAPAVAYLASKESGWLNGRIIGAQEYRISLWSNPEIHRQIVSDGPWDLDDVFTMVPQAFQSTVEGVRRFDEA
ncbi:MAG TPA: SDR family NAD(P)-dependent oxidoreductase [Nocardioidaceae bacterium]|jgi:NAD(P)-dependent dehydrogenase (short-subunit alcohol dehydrogenase family)